jgi:hypothetical protein
MPGCIGTVIERKNGKYGVTDLIFGLFHFLILIFSIKIYLINLLLISFNLTDWKLEDLNFPNSSFPINTISFEQAFLFLNLFVLSLRSKQAP